MRTGRYRLRASTSTELLWLVVLVAAAGFAGAAAIGKTQAKSIAYAGSSRPSGGVVFSAQAGAADLAKVADAAAFLADDVRAARTAKWAAPRFAAGQTSRPIQFSLEYEGQGEGIVHAYRPRSIPEKRWARMDTDAQWRWIDESARHSHSGDVMWVDFIRRDETPDLFRDGLDMDGSSWELKTHGYVETLDDLFDGATWLDEEVWGGGFHWHLSFPYNPRHLDAVLAYWRHGDEYIRLHALEQGADVVHSPFLQPLAPKNVNTARADLESSPKQPILGHGTKMHMVGLRSRIYREFDRIGLEIRGINHDLGHAARVVENTVRFLERPTSARLRFGEDGPRYRAADLLAVDHDAQFTMPSDVKRILRVIPNVATASTTQEFWKMPFLRWENRPFIDVSPKELSAARRRFVAEVRGYGARASATEWSEQAHRQAFGEMLHAWATDLGLSRFY